MSINWGDGTVSSGTYKALGPVNLDEIEFEVSGTHTYALGGKYPISITINDLSASPVNGNPIASIESTAIVVSPVTANRASVAV